MGRFAIAAYKPKQGKSQQLLAAVEKHMRMLRAEQLVSRRAARVMRGAHGTTVEGFEWRSQAEKAHKSPAVQALSGEFGAACDSSRLPVCPK